MFAAVLAGAWWVIANDSGPIHLAAIAGAVTVGVFGVSDPAITGAWGGRWRPIGGPGGWPSVDEVRAAAQLAYPP